MIREYLEEEEKKKKKKKKKGKKKRKGKDIYITIYIFEISRERMKQLIKRYDANESSRSRMRFFARARSRGLSRSQPVFVIIMLEKCMNICFINASSYFISFYQKQNFPRTR